MYIYQSPLKFEDLTNVTKSPHRHTTTLQNLSHTKLKEQNITVLFYQTKLHVTSQQSIILNYRTPYTSIYVICILVHIYIHNIYLIISSLVYVSLFPVQSTSIEHKVELHLTLCFMSLQLSTHVISQQLQQNYMSCSSLSTHK